MKTAFDSTNPLSIYDAIRKDATENLRKNPKAIEYLRSISPEKRKAFGEKLLDKYTSLPEYQVVLESSHEVETPSSIVNTSYLPVGQPKQKISVPTRTRKLRPINVESLYQSYKNTPKDKLVTQNFLELTPEIQSELYAIAKEERNEPLEDFFYEHKPKNTTEKVVDTIKEFGEDISYAPIAFVQGGDNYQRHMRLFAASLAGDKKQMDDIVNKPAQWGIPESKTIGGKGVNAVAEMVPSLVAGAGAKMAGGTAGGLLTMGNPAAITTGAITTSALHGFAMGWGEIYDTCRQAGLSHNESEASANWLAPLYAGIETVQLSSILKPLGITNKLVTKTSPELSKKLKEKGLLKRFAKGLLKSSVDVALESAEEGGQGSTVETAIQRGEIAEGKRDGYDLWKIGKVGAQDFTDSLLPMGILKGGTALAGHAIKSRQKSNSDEAEFKELLKKLDKINLLNVDATQPQSEKLNIDISQKSDSLDLSSLAKDDIISFAKDKTKIFNTPKFSNPETPEFVITPREKFESIKDFTDYLLISDEVAPKIRERLKYSDKAEEIWESDYLPLFAQKYGAKINGFNAKVKPQTEYQLARKAQEIINSIPDEEQSTKLEAISATDIRYLSNDHLEWASNLGEKWAEDELQKRISMEIEEDAFAESDDNVFNRLEFEGVVLPTPTKVARKGGSSEELNNIYSRLPNHLKAKYFSDGGRPLDEAAQLLGYEDENELLSVMDEQTSQLLRRIENKKKYKAEEAPLLPQGIIKKSTQNKSVSTEKIETSLIEDDVEIEFNTPTPRNNSKQKRNKPYKVFNAPNNAVEIRKYKKAVAESGWQPEKVEELVNKYYKKEHYNHLFENLDDVVFLSVPSTQGENIIPFEFAKRLASDFNGTVVFGNETFKNETNVEAKNKRSFISKLENPSDFKIQDANEVELLKGKNVVVVVDDTYTSGDTVLSFDRFLRQNGITPIVSVSLGKLGDKADVADEKHAIALAKTISSLTNISEDKIKSDIDIVLKGLSESLFIRAINESGANKSNARKVADLLAKRAGEIRHAQSSRESYDTEGWQASGQLGYRDLQNPRGKIGVSGVQGHRVVSGSRSSNGDISETDPLLGGNEYIIDDIGKVDPDGRFDGDKFDNGVPNTTSDTQETFELLKEVLGDANQAEAITNPDAQKILKQIKLWGEKLDPRMLDLPELIEFANEFLTNPVRAKDKTGNAYGWFKSRPLTTILDFLQGDNGLYHVGEKTRRGYSTIELRKDLFELVNATEKYRLCESAANEILKLANVDTTDLTLCDKLRLLRTTKIGDETQVSGIALFKQSYEEKLASLKEYKKNNGGTAVDATVVLAHEIGHLIDYLPQGLIRGRGNILGRIASLREYTSSTLSIFKANKQITKKQRQQFRQQAERWAANEMGIPKLVYYKNLRKYSKPIQEKFRKLVSEHYKHIVDEYCEKNNIVQEEDIRNELINVVAFWQNQKPEQVGEYFLQSKEMFAEGFSCFLCNPKKFAELAPKTHRVLMARMMSKEEVWTKWTELQMRLSNPKARIAKISERVSEMFNTARKDFVSTRKTIDDVHKKQSKNRWLSALWSQWQPIYNAAEKLAKIQKVSREEITEAIDNNRYSMSSAEAYVQQMNHDVYEPLIKNANTIDQLGKYMFCQRILHEREDIANPLGVTPAIAKQMREELLSGMSEPQKVEFLRIVKRMQKLRYKYVIKPIAEAKIFSEELTKKLSTNIYYTTFDVVEKDNLARSIDALMTDVFEGSGTGIFKQSGWLGNIKNPVEATLTKDIGLIMFTYRQKAIREYVKIMQLVCGDIITPAKKEFDPKTKSQRPIIHQNEKIRTLTYYDNGVLQAFYVPSVYGQPFFSRDIHWYERCLRAFNSLPKAFYTRFNHVFWVKGAIRDGRTLLERLPSPKGNNVIIGRLKVAKTVFPEYVKAVYSSFKLLFGNPDKSSLELLRRGLVVARSEYMGEKADETEIQKNLKQFGLNVDKIYVNTPKAESLFGRIWFMISNPFKKFWHIYSSLGQVAERAAKITAMKYMEKYHSSMPSAQKDQIIRETGGSPDFNNRPEGMSSAIWDFALLYYNPRIRGFEATWRTIKRNPVDGIFGMIAYGLPSLALKWAFRLGLWNLIAEWFKNIIPEDDIRDMRIAWERTSESERRAYDIFPLGKMVDDDGKEKYCCLRIPLEDSSKYVLAAFDAIMRGMAEQEYLETVGALGTLVADELYSMNPMLRIADNSIASLEQIIKTDGLSNPPESEFGPIMDTSTWRSGRAGPILKEAFRSLYNETAGSMFPRWRSDGMDLFETVEGRINLPVVRAFVGNFLYFPKGGVYESLREIDNELSIKQANHALDKREIISKWQRGEGLTEHEQNILQETLIDPQNAGGFIKRVEIEGKKKGNKMLGIVLGGNQSKEIKLMKLKILKDKGEITKDEYRNALIYLYGQ